MCVALVGVMCIGCSRVASPRPEWSRGGTWLAKADGTTDAEVAGRALAVGAAGDVVVIWDGPTRLVGNANGARLVVARYDPDGIPDGRFRSPTSRAGSS